jgi:chemotaxis protein MotB
MLKGGTKMRAANKKKTALMIALASVCFLSGCTNWKKKYNALYVDYENKMGLLDFERREKDKLAAQIAEDQATIDELQRRIGEKNQTPADATGFGPGYDVKFDASAGTITVTLPNAILFDSGKATLKSGVSKELNHIQSVLNSQYPARQIDVVGHTDTDPIKRSGWDDNLELSAQRALTVARYLIKRGIAEDKIKASGCGAARPVASNATAAGKAKNRRVEIVVHIRST